ncbi:hypothetical protein ACLOJK_016606 [Asimina triloba]
MPKNSSLRSGCNPAALSSPLSFWKPSIDDRSSDKKGETDGRNSEKEGTPAMALGRSKTIAMTLGRSKTHGGKREPSWSDRNISLVSSEAEN